MDVGVGVCVCVGVGKNKYIFIVYTMTDTSTLLPNTTAVPADCLYNLKPSSVRARSYRASIPTTNKSTFSPVEKTTFGCTPPYHN